MAKPYVIGFLTDFGLTDPYVGVCKAMICQLHPNCNIIDITHKVSAQDVLQGAIYLDISAKSFPKRTIFLAVVDPGVGTTRKPLVVKADKSFFICPDNGLCSMALRNFDCIVPYEIETPTFERLAAKHGLPIEKSQTFHARDIFAPAAALILNGIEPKKFCSRLQNPIKTVDMPQPVVHGKTVVGQILYFDSFGNAATNIRKEDMNALGCEGMNKPLSVRILKKSKTKKVIPFGKTFSSVGKGRPVSFINSFGLMEVAVNCGSARDLLGLSRGDTIEVECSKETKSNGSSFFELKPI